MKRLSLFVLCLSLFSQPARADKAAIIAAEQTVLNAIQAQYVALSNFTGAVARNVAAAIAPISTAVANAAAQAGAAVVTYQRQVAAAVASVQSQASASLSATWNNLVAYVQNVARYAPANYGAAYAAAAQAWTNANNDVNNWLNAQYTSFNNWYNAVTAPIYAWYNGIAAEGARQASVIQNAGAAQVQAANTTVSQNVAALTAQYNALKAQEAVADCPFAAQDPIIACQLVSNTAAGTDVAILMRTAVGNRPFRLFIPRGLPFPAPLILDLHGLGGDSAIQMATSQFENYTRAALLIRPDGYGRSWNAGICCGISRDNNIDEIDFLRKIIGTMKGLGAVDGSRIYVVGTSNGGMMAQRAGCEIDDVAGVGTVVGPNPWIDFNGNRAFTCRRKVPIIMFYGTVDPCVLFNGGQGICPVNSISALANFQTWSANNRCGNGTPTVVATSGPSVAFRNNSCDAGGDVAMVVVNGGSHGWFPASYGFDTSQLIIAFFAAHPLNGMSSHAIEAAPKQTGIMAVAMPFDGDESAQSTIDASVGLGVVTPGRPTKPRGGRSIN